MQKDFKEAVFPSEPDYTIGAHPVDKVAQWLCKHFDAEQIAEAVLRIKNKDVRFNNCPECGSENLTLGHFYGEGCVQPVSCDDCGHDWRDEYILSGQGVSSSNL